MHTEIDDIKKVNIVEKHMAYFTPGHGSPKRSLRVPESFSLYICPPSCARRIGIRSIVNGEMKDTAFLLMEEKDIISGDYVIRIGEAVEKISKIRKESYGRCPRAYVLYLNCVDDFLGTDEDALINGLEERFPDIVFTVCHINPVSDGSGMPRGMLVYDRLFSFLKKRTGDENTVNFIGNYVPIDRECELYRFFDHFGIKAINEPISMNTFEEYEKMANARCSLVFMMMGILAGQNMEKKFHIPYLFLPVTYDMDDVTEEYRKLADILDEPFPAELCQREKMLAEKSVRETLAAVKDVPIAVDTYGVRMPFSLARALKKYGFNVVAVFEAHAKEVDRENMGFIKNECKEIQIVKGFSYKEIKELNLPQELIAIGYDCAYSTKAVHFVDIRHDEGLFGFYGIRKMMEYILDAYRSTQEWNEESSHKTEVT